MSYWFQETETWVRASLVYTCKVQEPLDAPERLDQGPDSFLLTSHLLTLVLLVCPVPFYGAGYNRLVLSNAIVDASHAMISGA